MKRIITLLVLLTTSLFYAQTTGITYQAVIYNPTGEILPGNNNQNAVLANKDICLRFSIKDAKTNLEYQETQKVKTDEFGMVNVVIGQGDQIGGYSSNFDAILWNSTTKKLQVEMDTTGNCSVFIEVSDQDFSAVPFAYASKTAENVSGIVAIANGGTGASTVVGAKTNLGLNNVDNTSDANKPVSTATQTALDTKAPLASPALTGTPTVPTATIGTNTTQIANTAFVTSAIAAAATPDATVTVKGKIKLTGDLGGTADAPTVPGLANKENTIASGTTAQYYRGDKSWQTLDKATVGLGNVSNTADADKPVSTATQTVLNAKENTIAAGTTAQYYRGDKSWQTLDKATVGLGNVSNTADADKPVSTATQTALDTKEAAANKSTNPALGTSDDLFPTQKAVKTYVDNQISAGVVDATATVKGKIQLTGDLGGTADAPLVPELEFKAPLDSPQFIGTPSLPTGTVAVTQAANNNSTAVATTAYVTNALSTANSNARSSDLDMAGNSISNAFAIRAGNFQMVDEVLHPFFGGNDPNSVTIINRTNNVTQFVDGRTGSPILAITNSVNEEDDFGTPTPEEGKIGIGTTTPSEKLQVIGNIKSQSFIKENGTAGQFLKADGSVDANTYLTTTSATGTYEPIITAGTTAQYLRGDKTFQTLDKAAVGLGNVSNTADADKPVSTATQTALNAKENTIASGTTAQYYRGDKSWQTLDKTAVGLGNVSNTADADKPVSTATQTALDAKEAAANKSANPALGTSDDLFPTQKAVKTYVDNQISAGVVDASTSTKGKIQLTGDLGGTADAPVITAGAITATKLGNDAVEESKIKNGSVTTTKIADNAVTNAKLGEIVSVNKGGTGSNMSNAGAGYVKQDTNGANFTTVSSIPVAHVDGAVRKVNGVAPVDGNVSVLLGRVFQGDNVNPADATSVLAINDDDNDLNDTKESDIYIVVGHSDSDNNGRTFIFNGTNWIEVSTNLSTTDTRYVNVAGDTMAGDLTVPTGKKISIADAPSNDTDAANKAYVDGKVGGSGTENFVPKFSGTSPSKTLVNSSIFDDGTKVGIGTASPTTLLSVQGSANVDNANANTGTIANSLLFGNGTGEGIGSTRIEGSPNKFGLNFFTSSDIRMAITNSGFIGLGTTSPFSPLSNTSSNIFGSDGQGVNGFSWSRGASGYAAAIYNSGNTAKHNGLAVKVANNAATTYALDVSRGTTQDIAGTPLFNVLGNGNVGIGTTSPISLFSNAPSGTNFVGSNSATQSTTGLTWLTNNPGYTTSLYNANNVVGSNGLQVKVANSSPQTVAFEVGQNTSQIGISKPLFNVLGNGSVGVGTNAPTGQFEVASTNGLTAVIRRGGTASLTPANLILQKTLNADPNTHTAVPNGEFVGRIVFSASNGSSYPTNGTDIVGYAVGDQAANINGGGGILFRTMPFNVNPTTNSAIERMRIESNGRVGIGTSNNVTNTLDVVGGFNLRSTATAGTGPGGGGFGMEFNTNSSAPRLDWFYEGQYVGQFSSDANNFLLKNSKPTTGGFSFITADSPGSGSEKVRITNNGSVGIGTSTPTARLHTTGSVRFEGAGTPGAGKVLTSDASGNATWQSTSVNRQTANYTLTANDSKGVVIMDSNDPVTVIVPATLTAGFFCQIIQKGTGQVTVEVASGVSINSANGTKTRARYSSIGILMESGTEGYISGDSEF